jgi:glycosyltransferase involved in cell wall biosynthesis
VHVVHVIDSLGAGGAEKSLAEMLPGLRDRGIDGTVLTLVDRAEGFRDDVRAAGFDVRVVEARGAVGRVRGVRRAIAELEPDLVHTTLLRADIVGRLAAVGTGVPVLSSLVNTPYDAERLQDARVRRSRLAGWRLADGFTARHATAHLHAITGTVRDSAVRHLGVDAADVTVIGRGRDAARLGTPSPARRAAVRERLGLAADTPLVVNVGRQEGQKAQWVLLRAAPRLAAAVPGTVVLVAGRSGNASPDLQALLADPAVGDVVRLLGHRDDVPDLLAAADVFVFPSIFEGLGGSVIEAMALGLPIVATDLPVLREVVDDGVHAVLVPAQDPAALADAVAALLRDDERRRAMGEAGRQRFDERHSLERVTAEMAELYHRIVTRESA